MPPARRSGAKTSGPAASGGQRTLTFGNKSKVTKSGVPVTSHSAKKDAILLQEVSDNNSVASSKESYEPTTAEIAIEDQTKAEVKRPRTEEELEALKITDQQVKKYWRDVEAERLAPRVHQKDLTLNEKILRHFDLSSHYGPCVGIARLKRWNRANNLNLHPPIEVLAVLLKEEERNNKAAQRAYVDELLSSKLSVD